MILAIMDCNSSHCEKSIQHAKGCRDHSRCIQVRHPCARRGTTDRASPSGNRDELISVMSLSPFAHTILRTTAPRSKKTLTPSMTSALPAEPPPPGRSPLDDPKTTASSRDHTYPVRSCSCIDVRRHCHRTCTTSRCFTPHPHCIVHILVVICNPRHQSTCFLVLRLVS